MSLNKQFVRLLSARGVPDEVFLGKQETYFKELDSLLEDRNLQVNHGLNKLLNDSRHKKTDLKGQVKPFHYRRILMADRCLFCLIILILPLLAC